MTGGFFAILDDIALLMDDAAAVTKVAAKKTAGVLGDDLAVNAEKASGFHASRELPVLWAISKGSMLNKVIILPFAFLLSAFFPQAIVPILLIGGVYLNYEGAEKILGSFIPHGHEDHGPVQEATSDTMVDVETQKIRSAIITDFILSIEIIVIALGSMLDRSMTIQLIGVSAIALLATVGVYGIVAVIVRLDDMGQWLLQASSRPDGTERPMFKSLGHLLIGLLPTVIRALSVIGTIAMLLVGGGMFVHNIHAIHHWVEWMPSIIGDFVVGMVVGSIAIVLVTAAKKVWPAKASSK